MDEIRHSDNKLRAPWRAFLFLMLLLPSIGFTSNDTHGLWIKGGCDEPGPVKIINRFGILDLLPIETTVKIQVYEFVDDSDKPTRKVKSLNSDKTFDIQLVYSSRKLNDEYRRCEKLPALLSWSFGEAAAGFGLLGESAEKCREKSGEDCFATIFQFVDVSDDDVLSRAEISRMVRIIGFYIGYMSQQDLLVEGEKLMASTTVAGVASMYVAESIIDNVDYDDDGRVSIPELLQDKGDGAGLADISAGITMEVLRNLMRDLVAQAPGLLKGLMGFM